MKKHLLGVVSAVALTVGMAGTASAMTAGTISTGDGNNGVDNIYNGGVSPASIGGWYGGQIYLFASQATTLYFTFLGREAGNNNQFVWNSEATAMFSNTDIGQDAWSIAGFDTDTRLVNPGLLPFLFRTNTILGNAVNGANPDNTLPNSAVNFFATIVSCPTCTSGTAIDLWLDDGNTVDDNHDDMAIRISVEGGRFQVVPIPAAAWLLGSGLLGLFGIARRRSVTAA